MPNAHPTVLVLDDFPDASEAVAAWLEIEGWHPIVTSTPDEALDALARAPVAAVIMEPYLRLGSAMHVAEAARDSQFGRPLIVSVSGRGREGDHTAYEPTLFDFNLVKPVLMEQLSTVLTTAKHRRCPAVEHPVPADYPAKD
ncbi:response regulator [Roseateles noduli]|uniref:response regulator n=1 Tax=Roseateles noduli TaxID=2052484 RepID=UPI003D6531C5